jgi:hypothetical protein
MAPAQRKGTAKVTWPVGCGLDVEAHIARRKRGMMGRKRGDSAEPLNSNGATLYPHGNASLSYGVF